MINFINKCLGASVKLLLNNWFFCFLILSLIVILILGTLEQRNINIISVKHLYFDSNFIWLFHNIPFLGAGLIFKLLFLILLIKIPFDIYNKKRFYIIIIHSSVLIIMFGCFLTNHFGSEGSIIIKENESNNLIINDNVFAINIKRNNRLCLNRNINLNEKNNLIYSSKDKNFKIYFVKIFRNVNFSIKKNFLTNHEAEGLARFFNFINIPIFIELDKNKTCFLIKAYYNNIGKIYCFLNETKNFSLTLDQENYTINILKSVQKLPFLIKLVKFKKETYKSTDIPKSYESHVLIMSNNKNFMYIIKMNHPLNFRNYRFFQSSFIEKNGDVFTVLSVTKNPGHVYPYVSIFILIFGFVFYFIKRLK